MRKRGLDVGVWLIVLLGAFVWWISVVDDVGKLPQDTQVTITTEKDLRTGQIYDVQVTKCRRCGQTISWVRFNKLGLPISGNMNATHDCGKVWGKHPKDEAGFMKFDGWLDKWQRRLSHR